MTAHKFRIAFCILCHKYTPVLEELIRILNVPGNEIFIHVDGNPASKISHRSEIAPGYIFSNRGQKSIGQASVWSKALFGFSPKLKIKIFIILY